MRKIIKKEVVGLLEELNIYFAWKISSKVKNKLASIVAKRITRGINENKNKKKTK